MPETNAVEGYATGELALQAAAAGALRTRVSANSFRDLTARLKKTDVPPMQVAVAAVAPAPEAAITEPDQPVFEPQPPHPVDEPLVLEVQQPEPPVQEPLQPSPQILAAPEPELEIVIDAAPVAAADAVALVEEPEVDVPHAPSLEAVQEALKQAAIRRQDLHEIETIWRQLVAKPTADDMAQYLKEAAEITAVEGYTPPKPSEHDLSVIEPASETVPVVATEINSTIAEAVVKIAAQVDDTTDTSELARTLLDLMASGSSAGQPQERALAADTLLRMLPKLELKPLVLLSRRLAIMDNPPALLVGRLIRDPRVEISGPLLEDCIYIADRDLQMVVDENQPGKLRTIARRRRLSTAISDLLIATNEPSVLLTLVRNMDAEISHDGFVALIAASASQSDLLAPLSTRPDFSAPFAFELFWHAPAQLRRFLLTRFLTDSETLTKILKITLTTGDDEERETETPSQYALLEALERASRGKLEQAAEELGEALQIAPITAAKILADNQGEPLVVLLKAAAYPRSAVLGLLSKLRDCDLPVIAQDRELNELQSMFETLSFNKARILLTYWDWAQRKTGPYAPAH